MKNQNTSIIHALMATLVTCIASAATSPPGPPVKPASRSESDYPPNINPFAPKSIHHGPAGYTVPPGMVHGAAFIDRILPMAPGAIRNDVWGVSMTGPRNVDNGLEDPKWSYWCMSVHRNPQTNKYEMIASRWAESAPKGHMAWPSSLMVYALSDKAEGPYEATEANIGSGHNAWVYRTKDGRWVQYFIGGARIASDLSGPWTPYKIVYDYRGTPTRDWSNHTFTSREDGSVLMLSRGGRTWISEDGLKPFRKITYVSPYPKFKGAFEDPCVWRDNVQYNMIVNDWYGKQAYYMRSPDGVNWTLDEGLAYTPHVARNSDGSVEKWWKMERPNVIQDDHGRATHLTVAAIDTLKLLDQPNDNHSSKILVLPLLVPRLVEVLPQDAKSEMIRVRIKAEQGFSPAKDLDFSSLRFGPPEEVDFGRGIPAGVTETVGNDLIVSFKAKSLTFSDRHFVGKLLGRDRKNCSVFGFARLPSANFTPALLSVEPPKLTGAGKVSVCVDNSGLSTSQSVPLLLKYRKPDGIWVEMKSDVPALKPYQSIAVEFSLATEPLTGWELVANLPSANGCTGEAKTVVNAEK